MGEVMEKPLDVVPWSSSQHSNPCVLSHPVRVPAHRSFSANFHLCIDGPDSLIASIIGGLEHNRIPADGEKPLV